MDADIGYVAGCGPVGGETALGMQLINCRSGAPCVGAKPSLLLPYPNMSRRSNTRPARRHVDLINQLSVMRLWDGWQYGGPLYVAALCDALHALVGFR